MTRTGIHKSSSSSVEKEMLAILLQPYMGIIKNAKRCKIQKQKKSSQKKEAKIKIIFATELVREQEQEGEGEMSLVWAAAF